MPLTEERLAEIEARLRDSADELGYVSHGDVEALVDQVRGSLGAAALGNAILREFTEPSDAMLSAIQAIVGVRLPNDPAGSANERRAQASRIFRRAVEHVLNDLALQPRA